MYLAKSLPNASTSIISLGSCLSQSTFSYHVPYYARAQSIECAWLYLRASVYVLLELWGSLVGCSAVCHTAPPIRAAASWECPCLSLSIARGGVASRGDCRGWFHNHDTSAIVKQQLQYYRDIGATIAILSMHLALSLALSNDHVCVVFGQSCSQYYRCTSMWRCTLYTQLVSYP